MNELSGRMLSKDFKGEEVSIYWLVTSPASVITAYDRKGLIYTLKCLLFNKPYIRGLRTSENSKFPGMFTLYHWILITEVIRMLILETVAPLK